MKRRVPAELGEAPVLHLISPGLAGYGGVVNRDATSCTPTCSQAQKFERRLAALRLATLQACAMTKAAPGADEAVNQTVMRLAQTSLFETFVDLDEAQVDLRPSLIAALGRGVAKIAWVSAMNRKWQAEMLQKVEHVNSGR
jgi:hypothetical protein